MRELNFDFGSFLLGMIVGVLIFVFVRIANREAYTTKKPKRPDVTVTIKNGVADTTYTYKFD